MPIRKLEEVCVFNSKVYYPQITYDNTPTNSAKGKSKGNIYLATTLEMSLVEKQQGIQQIF